MAGLNFLNYWPIFTASLSLYLLVSAVFRLFFHPLKGFPGPRLAALTWYYQGYYEFIQDGGLVEHLEQLHQIYGPIVRIGPNDLHFSDPRAYASIYAVGSKFRKDPKLYKCFVADGSSFGKMDPHEAKIRKDILSPLFSRRAILKLESVIKDKIDTFVSQLLSSQYQNKPINMYKAFHSTSLDIISSYCFARSYDAISAPNFEHPILISLDAATPVFWLFKYVPFMTIMLRLPDWLSMRFTPESQGLINLRKQLSAQIDGLLADPSSLEGAEQESVYHHLLSPQPEKGQYVIPSKKSLLDEAANLLFAGTDTVGNASMVGTFYVLNDRAIQEELLRELQQAWPDKDSPIRYETLEKLPYFTAVIKESLRLSHGVLVGLPRIVGPPGTTAQIAGAEVPAGVVVSIGATFVHLNEEIFPNPHTFNPERWLQSNSRTLDNYLVAFSRGPRSCIGLNLAWCELYLILANVFRKLDMEIYNTSVEDLKARSHFLPIYRGRPFQAIVKERMV